jgi:hypothetical protein
MKRMINQVGILQKARADTRLDRQDSPVGVHQSWAISFSLSGILVELISNLEQSPISPFGVVFGSQAARIGLVFKSEKFVQLLTQRHDNY